MSQELKKVEAKGFMLGTQGVGTAAALAQFAAIFGRRAEAIQQKFAPRLQRLAAQIAIWEKRKNEAAARWAEMQTLAGDYLPPVIVPLLAFVVAFLLLGGETFLLAPVLDGLGIADPFEQKFVAGVVVLAAAAVLEVSAYLYRTPDTSFGWRVFCMLLSGATLILLGWWRAAELIHAAAQGQGALQTFLTQTEGLTSMVVTLLTIILPVGATLALDWGATQLRLAWAWRNARRGENRAHARHERLAKRLEARREVLARKCAALEQERAEWQNAFQQAYELGQHIGVHRLPFWQVAQKIAAAGVLIITGAFRLAAEEAQRQTQAARDKNHKLQVRIVALSDFIQDDTQGLNFKRDPRLANTDAARKFAAAETERRGVDLQGATILLGSLRSDDLKLLNQERREALRVFWSEYCRAAHAASVNFATDGIGALAK